MHTDTYDVDIDVLLTFAKRFRDLGNAVSDQVEDLLDGRGHECNPNAVNMIKRRLGGMNEDLDNAIAEYDDKAVSAS